MTRHLGVSVRRRAATTKSRSTGCPVEQQCTPVTRRPATPHRGGRRPPLDSWSTTLAGRFHDRLRRPRGRLRPYGSPEERPTSRLCSTDESVTFSNHCRSGNVLSFHGLCSPPRSSAARSLDDMDVLSTPKGAEHGSGTRMSLHLTPGLTACRTSHPSFDSPMQRAAPRPKSSRCVRSLSGLGVARPDGSSA